MIPFHHPTVVCKIVGSGIEPETLSYEEITNLKAVQLKHLTGFEPARYFAWQANDLPNGPQVRKQSDSNLYNKLLACKF